MSKTSEQEDKPVLIGGKWSFNIYQNGKLHYYGVDLPRLRSIECFDSKVLLGTMNGLYEYDTLTRKLTQVIDNRL